MRRTQIYVTDEQDARLAEIAADHGISKSEAIRRILDRALDAGDADREARAVIAATAGICAGYPDWPDWLRSVRGQTADERLRAAGL
jgi:alkylhydroperoxidase/carboxymuconolactone decarboxylase family protein YurZ